MTRGVYKRKVRKANSSKIKWICPECHSIKYITINAAKKRKCCSHSCATLGKNNPMYGKKQKQSSKDNMSISHMGVKQSQEHKLKHTGRNYSKWKGEKFLNTKNRWEIWIDEKRMSQARYIAEQYLKRKLTSKEVVHHINGDCSDDRPENLYIFENQSKHMQHHGWRLTPLLMSNLLLTKIQ